MAAFDFRRTLRAAAFAILYGLRRYVAAFVVDYYFAAAATFDAPRRC